MMALILCPINSSDRVEREGNTLKNKKIYGFLIILLQISKNFHNFIRASTIFTKYEFCCKPPVKKGNFQRGGRGKTCNYYKKLRNAMGLYLIYFSGCNPGSKSAASSGDCGDDSALRSQVGGHPVCGLGWKIFQ